MNLENKIIVVTGGNGLLGKSILNEIRKNKGIGICGDINVNESKNYDHYLDITDESSVNRLIEKLINKYGKIDGWVNNAYPRTDNWGESIEDLTLRSWKKNIDMHLGGYFMCCQKILKQMKTQKKGSLINMSSIYGIVGPDFNIYDGTNLTNSVEYSAIKGGLINLSRYLASYYGKYNVRVNCISPGGVFDSQPEPFYTNYKKKVPMGRMALPNDISPSVCFLLSDVSNYITGHNLVIDGGWTAI